MPDRPDLQNVWELLAYGILAVYKGGEWIVYGFLYPGIWWLWNLTPYHWPGWAKALVYPATLAVLYILTHPFTLYRRFVRPKLFGDAIFASLRNLRRSGMMVTGGRFIGTPRKPNGYPYRFRRVPDLYLHGEGHCLTIAAPGAGKTTGLIIPTLLTYTAGTVVVTDPKGAITAQTARYRRGLGRVVVLNPWREALKSDPAFGLDLGDDGFNPLQGVAPDEEGRGAASLVASLLLPDMPGEESYWRQEGRELLEWAMVWQAIHLPAEQRTLPHLHGLLYDVSELAKILELCAAAEPRNNAAGWALKAGASKLYGLIATGAGSQFAGIVSTATTALKIYGRGMPLAEHASKPGGFRLADLKNPDERLTLYVICPPDKLVGDERKWLNLVLAMVCQQIGKPGFAAETVLLVDEFPALGYLPNLLGSLEQFREAGLRAHLIAQNVGQMLTYYGEPGLRRFWGVCEFKQFARVIDPLTAEFLSAALGQRTAWQPTTDSNGRVSVSQVGVPLMRPEDILTMRKNVQIVMRPEGSPIAANIILFYERSDWRGLVDENPYRRKRGGKSPFLPFPQGKEPAAGKSGATMRVAPEAGKKRTGQREAAE